jgi:phosphoserine phosphatase
MRQFELVVFDVDGTLVQGPGGLNVWQLLNRRFTGGSEINKQRYAQYKQGKLSYADWVELDVSGWRDAGATRKEVIAALEPLELIGGTRETLDRIKSRGIRLAAISGTIDVMLETIYPDHPFDEVYANHIGFAKDGSIEHWRATPFDMQGKAKALRAIALREGIPLSRCAFVGDSDNDVWIAREAGFSVAFNPQSEELVRIADAVVRSSDLRDILPHLFDGAH